MTVKRQNISFLLHGWWRIPLHVVIHSESHCRSSPLPLRASCWFVGINRKRALDKAQTSLTSRDDVSWDASVLIV